MRLAVGADADPIAGGALEVDDIGAGIIALQSLMEPPGFTLMMEDADLDAPASPLRSGGRIAEHVDADTRCTGSPDADFQGGGSGEIQNAARNKGPAISNCDDDGLAGGEIGDADDGAHGQGAMGGGHGVLVIDLAVGGVRIVVRRTVPAGNANFTVKDGAAGFGGGLGGKSGGRSLHSWRRRGRGGLDMVMTAAGDGEAEYQQSGQSGAKGVLGIPELHSL